MQIKSIAMMVVAGCVIGLSTGCVKQADFDNMKATLEQELEDTKAAMQAQIDEKDAALISEQDMHRNTRNDVKDAVATNEELKKQIEELKGKVESLNTQVSTVRSQLTRAEASISSARDEATAAADKAAAALAKEEKTRVRYNELIENLINLNKVNPVDLGFELTKLQ